jgi:hypothetical protein
MRPISASRQAFHARDDAEPAFAQACPEALLESRRVALPAKFQPGDVQYVRIRIHLVSGKFEKRLRLQ